MADFLNGLFISELLADNAGGSAIDTDGDGNTNKADEFIELGNVSGETVSLDGFEVWSEKNGLLYAFGPGDELQDGDTATIVGNYTGTPPSGFYDAGFSESTNFIPDGEGQKFDTIFLVDTSTGEYITLSYGRPPRAPTLPNGFTGTTQVGTGETIDSTAPNGTAFARDANGTLIETTPTPGTPNIACFLRGTQIATATGLHAIEDLRPGARVITRDAGVQPVLSIRHTHVPRSLLLQYPDLRPIWLRVAEAPLGLSPRHRILIRHPLAELLTGNAEALASAAQFLRHDLAWAEPKAAALDYFHLIFERHVLVLAGGIWTESLFLGDLPEVTQSASQTRSLETDPDLLGISHRCTVRPVLRGFEADLILPALRRAHATVSRAA